MKITCAFRVTILTILILLTLPPTLSAGEPGQSAEGVSSYLGKFWVKVRAFAPKKQQSSNAAAVAGIKGAEKGTEELTPYWKGEEKSTLEKEVERYGIAAGLMEKKQYAEAEVVLASFREEFPQSSFMPQVLFAAGLCNLETGRKEAATDLLKRFVEKYPNDELAADAANLLSSLEKGGEDSVKKSN